MTKRIFIRVGMAMVTATLILLPSPAAAQDSGSTIRADLPLSRADARAISEELSGEIAMHHVREIARYHRIQASPMMRESAVYVRRQLLQYGLDDAEIESFPSDGRRSYSTWLSPVGWTVEEAELWLVAPGRRLLTRYSEIANALVTLSASADEEGILIDAGTGLDPEFYESTDVTGKIVLASGYGGEVHRLAVLRHGALGVVCWNDRPQYPDQVRYTGMWPKAGERERIRWGFNISYRTAQELKALLSSGEEVRLHALVENGELKDGSLDIVTATIPGYLYPDQEIILMAHLDHPKPGSNDNASGSAALLDIARGLTALIESERLGRPERTIRFLWVAEMYGTAAWLDAHPEVSRRTAFGINLDMVGTPAQYSVLQVIKNPASSSSILDLVISGAASWVSGLDTHEPRGTSQPMNYRVVPYSGGSDHYMFIDGAIGVPSVMLNTWPDPFYHTSDETPDKIDPTTLKRAELIATAAAWSLACFDPSSADALLEVQVAEALKRLALDKRSSIELLATMDRNMEDIELALLKEDSEKLLEAQLEREFRAVSTLMRLVTADVDSSTLMAFRQAVTRARAALGSHGSVIKESVMETELSRIMSDLGILRLPQLLPIDSIPERKEARSLVYERTTSGPITDDWFLDHLSADRRRYYTEGAGRALMQQPTLRYEIVNFVNGTRNALEIRNAVSAEFGPQSLESIVTYLEDLQAAGLLIDVSYYFSFSHAWMPLIIQSGAGLPFR